MVSRRLRRRYEDWILYILETKVFKRECNSCKTYQSFTYSLDVIFDWSVEGVGVFGTRMIRRVTLFWTWRLLWTIYFCEIPRCLPWWDVDSSESANFFLEMYCTLMRLLMFSLIWVSLTLSSEKLSYWIIYIPSKILIFVYHDCNTPTQNHHPACSERSKRTPRIRPSISPPTWSIHMDGLGTVLLNHTMIGLSSISVNCLIIATS